MISPALRRRASETYTAKKAGGTGGQTGALSTTLTGLQGTPLYPVSSETMEREKLEAPYLARELFIIGAPALHPGMYLSDGTTDYRIKGVQPWTGNNRDVTLVVVELQVTS